MRANKHVVRGEHTVASFARMGEMLALLDPLRFAEVASLLEAIVEGDEAREGFRKYGLPILAGGTDEKIVLPRRPARLRD